MNKIYNKWNKTDGEWEFSENKLVQKNLHGVARCYQNFEIINFIVNFNIKMIESSNVQNGEGKFIFSDANVNENFRVDFMYNFNSCRIIASNWQLLSPLQLVKEKEYKIRIAVKDNLISVEVDDMSIIKNFNFGKKSDGYIGFGTYNASVEFSDCNIQCYKEKKCFIVMPFDQKRNFLYDYAIKPALERHPEFVFNFIRADESLTVGKISDEINEAIKDSDVIIADITENNRNVFYELGYAHAYSRKAILLIEEVKGEKLNIPFDIQDFRCHTYSFSKEGFEKIQKRINKLLSNILS